MKDLNSLALFNQLYTNELVTSYSSSLLDFFKTDVLKRLPSEAKILDIGSGSKSLFEEYLGLSKKNITAVDFSSVAILKANINSQIKYLEMDITVPNILGEGLYDLVFDSHCLQCITDRHEREYAFRNIYNSLRPSGIAAFEMMTIPLGRPVNFPGKYIVESRELEQEILAHGFKIKYFVIERNIFFENEDGKCDLVRTIIEK